MKYGGENEDRALILVVTPRALHDYLKSIKRTGRKTKTLPSIDRIRMIVMDEVHVEYFGKELSKTIIEDFLKNVSKDAVVIGLSATPTRQAIEKIGRLVYSLTSLRAMKEGILIGKLKIYQRRTKTNLKDINKDPWKVAVIERA